MPFQDWIADAKRLMIVPVAGVTVPEGVTPRAMYDSAAPDGIPQSAHGLVAGYYTGTPGEAWLGHPMDVSIDQAGAAVPGRDRTKCTAKDVEPGCYRPADIHGFVWDESVERPTVYCDRSDEPAVLNVWKGDIWLAWPGWNGQSLHPQVKVVQNNFGSTVDQSVILDPHWPAKAPVTPPPPPPPKTPNPQYDWRACAKCIALVHGPEASRRPCAAGGNHVINESHDYGVGWRLCTRGWNGPSLPLRITSWYAAARTSASARHAQLVPRLRHRRRRWLRRRPRRRHRKAPAAGPPSPRAGGGHPSKGKKRCNPFYSHHCTGRLCSPARTRT